MRPSLPGILLGLLCLPLACGCQSGGSSGGGSTGLLTGNRGTGSVPIPGDTRRAGREGIQTAPVKELTPAEVEARRQRSVQVAEQLWRQAEAAEPRNPEGAGDAYREIAENHTDSPRAAEAKFREGRAYVRAGEYRDGVEALERYMDIAPANPYLAEIERMVFESGKRYLAGIRGLKGVFMSRDIGYEMLAYVPRTFPNGALADDALLELGASYTREDDKDAWIEAVQHYKSLLLSYPESDLRPAAWLGLARVYMVRDQGAAWHGGYVEIDPREEQPEAPEQMAFAGPVTSAPRLALEAYESLLAENERQPGVASAAQVAEAQAGVRAAKERLAAKDARIAALYGGLKGGQAADPYRRSAARLRGQAEPPPRAPSVIPPAGPPPGGFPPSTVAPTPPGVAPPTPPGGLPPGPPPTPPGPPPPSVPPPTPPMPPEIVPPATPPSTPPSTPPDPFQPATNPPVAPPPLPSSLPPPRIRRTTSNAAGAAQGG